MIAEPEETRDCGGCPAGCECSAGELHECPYQRNVHEGEKLCNCCDECTLVCVDAI